MPSDDFAVRERDASPHAPHTPPLPTTSTYSPKRSHTHTHAHAHAHSHAQASARKGGDAEGRVTDRRTAGTTAGTAEVEDCRSFGPRYDHGVDVSGSLERLRTRAGDKGDRGERGERESDSALHVYTQSGSLSGSLTGLGSGVGLGAGAGLGSGVGLSASFSEWQSTPLSSTSHAHPTSSTAHPSAPFFPTSTSTSTTSGEGEGVHRPDHELIELLSKPPKTVPALRTKSSFQDFFRGMPVQRMQFLLEKSCATLVDVSDAERAQKVKKRMELLHEVLVVQ